MILHERGLYFKAGGITFKQLFEHVMCNYKFFNGTTALSRPKLTFYFLAFLHQILNHSADVYLRAILANFSDLGQMKTVCTYLYLLAGITL